MFYTYVIQSQKDKTFYKGHCENLNKRIHQHNSGLTKSIKSKTPFELVYAESFFTREEAMIREKYFKSYHNTIIYSNTLLCFGRTLAQ